MEFSINEKCIHCGKCINDCMGKALKFDENKIPVLDETKCIKCQHCLAVCPAGALSIMGKNPDESERPDNLPSGNEVLNLIKNRRSIRHYKHENIDKDKLEKLKDMLSWVPTGVNNHGLHFAFIDDVEVMDEFRDYTNGKMLRVLTCCDKKNKILTGITEPVVKFLTKKFARYKDSFLKGEDIIFRGAPHMVVVSTPVDAPCADIDPTIALSYFELYASSLGIGTCWCGLAYAMIKVFPELCEHLEIPQNYKVGYVMLFGNPDTSYPRSTQPEPCKIISVKKGIKNSTIQEKAKRFFWNFVR